MHPHRIHVGRAACFAVAEHLEPLVHQGEDAPLHDLDPIPSPAPETKEEREQLRRRAKDPKSI